MTNDQTGRTPRQTTGGSPAASTIAIVVTVVAVVIGFLILKKIRDDGGTSASPAKTTIPVATTVDPQLTTTIAATEAPTTTFPLVVTGTSVQVANASGANGVAKSLATILSGQGFTLVASTNGTGPKLATSKVYYDTANPSAKAVADSAAHIMGGIAVEPAPTPVPTNEAKLPTGVGVLVMLGNDKAGKSLEQLSGATTTSVARGGAPTTSTIKGGAVTTSTAPRAAGATSTTVKTG